MNKVKLISINFAESIVVMVFMELELELSNDSDNGDERKWSKIGIEIVIKIESSSWDFLESSDFIGEVSSEDGDSSNKGISSNKCCQIDNNEFVEFPWANTTNNCKTECKENQANSVVPPLSEDQVVKKISEEESSSGS